MTKIHKFFTCIQLIEKFSIFIASPARTNGNFFHFYILSKINKDVKDILLRESLAPANRWTSKMTITGGISLVKHHFSASFYFWTFSGGTKLGVVNIVIFYEQGVTNKLTWEQLHFLFSPPSHWLLHLPPKRNPKVTWWLSKHSTRPSRANNWVTKLYSKSKSYCNEVGQQLSIIISNGKILLVLLHNLHFLVHSINTYKWITLMPR